MEAFGRPSFEQEEGAIYRRERGMEMQPYGAGPIERRFDIVQRAQQRERFAFEEDEMVREYNRFKNQPRARRTRERHNEGQWESEFLAVERQRAKEGWAEEYEEEKMERLYSLTISSSSNANLSRCCALCTMSNLLSIGPAP